MEEAELLQKIKEAMQKEAAERLHYKKVEEQIVNKLNEVKELEKEQEKQYSSRNFIKESGRLIQELYELWGQPKCQCTLYHATPCYDCCYGKDDENDDSEWNT